MHEYFEAFAGEGLRPVWEYLATWSTFMAIVMIALELFVGFCLVMGWKPKFTVTVIWLLTLFFTVLTGYTFLSGYGITKSFLLAGVIVATVFAVIPFLKTETKRTNMLFFSLGILIVVFLSFCFV